MVLPRILTAIVLIPLVLAAVWFGSLPYFIFILGISVLCLWEFCVMAEQGGYPNQLIMSLMGGIALLLALFIDGIPLWGPLHKAPSPFFVFILWFFLLFVREFFSRDKGLSFLRISISLTGVVLCSLLLGHLLLLRDLRLVAGEGFRLIGRDIVYFLFFVVWSLDVSAWGIGRSFGRFRMAPRMSPNKTWEGAIGGTLVACLVGWFLREAFLRDAFGAVESVIYAFIIAVSAQVSDVIESLAKRSFGVKNSSELLPGHGGLLDRFDSFIFSAPFFYYILLATGRFQ